jgi:general stress protein 26
MFKAHWTPDLDAWFQEGADTPGLVLIRVRAEQIRYWDGPDQGALDVAAGSKRCPDTKRTA